MLPKGWRSLPIGSVVLQSQYGLNLAVDANGTTPIIGMKDMVAGRIRNSGWGSVSLNEGDKARYLLQRGDILLNRTNSPDLVGKVAIWDRTEEAVFPSYIVRFKLDEQQACPAYVNLVLNTADGQSRLRQIATRGVSQANINPTTFQSAYLITLPPLPEQRRIAAVLDAWDTAIIKAERLVDVRRTLERRTFTALSRLWGTVAVGNLGRLIGGGTPSKARPEFWGGSIPWISSKDMAGWEISETEDKITEAAVRESATQVVPAGSVLTVVRSGILRHTVPITLAMRPVAINQDIKALLVSAPYRGALIGRVLVLENERLRGATVKTGTTVESIDMAALKEFEIPYPEHSYAKAAEALLLDLRIEYEIAEKRVSRLRLQKRGLMQQFLTGKLHVPESIDALLPPTPELVAPA